MSKSTVSMRVTLDDYAAGVVSAGQGRTSWPRPLVVRPADTRIGPAVRSATAMGLPLLVLVLAGHPQAASYAAFGAFTGLYAAGLPFRRRARALAGTGAGFVLAVAAGSACAVASSSLGATGWVLAVAGGRGARQVGL